MDRTNRRTVAYFPSLGRKDQLSTQVFMFVQDLSESIVPYSSFVQKPSNYRPSMEGTVEGIKAAQRLLQSLGGGHHSGEESIEDVIREIAGRLAWSGEVLFEIYSDEHNFQVLGEIPQRRLIRLPGMYVQVVPRRDHVLLERKVAFIGSRFVWRISIPRELGGVSRYRRLLRQLPRADTLAPKFWQPGKPGNVDMLEYNRLRECFIAKISREIGWTWRNSSQSGITEFYYFHRALTFLRAQAVLREHLIRELNKLLGRLNIAAKIVVAGLPSPSELDDIMARMAEGKVSFASAYKVASPY